MVQSNNIHIRFKVATVTDLRRHVAAFKPLFEQPPVLTVSGSGRITSANGKGWSVVRPRFTPVTKIGQTYIAVALKTRQTDQILVEKPTDFANLHFEMR